MNDSVLQAADVALADDSNQDCLSDQGHWSNRMTRWACSKPADSVIELLCRPRL